MATTKSTKRHMSKAERQQARERAQERAQAALDRLGEGVREVYQSERWESWLRSLSKFHDYSLGNTILIASICFDICIKLVLNESFSLVGIDVFDDSLVRFLESSGAFINVEDLFSERFVELVDLNLELCSVLRRIFVSFVR